MVLYINACVRAGSRTKIIADGLITKLSGPVTELRLENIDFPKVDEAFLLKRDRLIAEHKFNDPMFDLAGQFAEADTIVIAAPFWDLSFPAAVKQYIELINVVGITFEYTNEGIPRGLCAAKRLYYVTTAGGDFFPEDYGYGYVKALAQNFYGIQDVRLIKATGLDILGADVDRIIKDTMRREYTLAIFDMDGTILNTLEDLADSMNYCLERFHLPRRSLEEIRGFLGNGARRLVELSVPSGTEPSVIDEILGVFGPYYNDHCAIKTRPYEGITDLIMELRKQNILTSVVSNKPDSAVGELCKTYFNGLFDYYVGDRPGQNRKPAPDSVIAVLDHFNISRENAVYIGDSEVDYQTALNAGLDVIMVSWGFRTEDYLKSIGAKIICHTADEVLDLL